MTTVALTSKELISDQLWSRMINRMQTDLEFWQYFGRYDEPDRQRWAERILDQTLAFLRVCADDPDPGRFSPSPLVDIGWHTFILYTSEYAGFCQDVAGHFIHHNPTDQEGVAGGSAEAVVAAMKAREFAVDDALWGTGASTCVSSSCSPPAGPKPCAPQSCSPGS